ncbi:MAG: hypothetical protein QOK40_3680 [Miltoncostaeaceae bacterium]|jgi:hypothetical protein|nr:hypothetical protein [Miltoncostaeaceae bacterium]
MTGGRLEDEDTPDREPDAPDAAEEGAPGAGPAGSSLEAERPGRRGAIASEIYEQVERILLEGISKSEAFARIAGETGRRAASVAANYYRAARRRGEGGPPAPTAPGQVRASRGRAWRAAGGGDDAAAVLERARAALQELADLAHRQEQELSRLRADNQHYDEIRSLIDGGRRARGRGAG